MSLLKSTSIALCLLTIAACPSMAADATCAEAKTLQEKAVALYKAEGSEKAIAKFMDKNGGFVDRDLYVFVQTKEGVFLAHPAKPALIGKSGAPIKDADGKLIFESFMPIKDKGEVHYRWPHPENEKIRSKTSYVNRMEDGNFVAVGCYSD